MTPDAVMWNTLITLAGRAGQLQRALDTVSEMEVCAHSQSLCDDLRIYTSYPLDQQPFIVPHPDAHMHMPKRARSQCWEASFLCTSELVVDA